MLFEMLFKIEVQYDSSVKGTGRYYKSLISIPCGILAEIFAFLQTFRNVVTWLSHDLGMRVGGINSKGHFFNIKLQMSKSQ